MKPRRATDDAPQCSNPQPERRREQPIAKRKEATCLNH